MIAGCIADAQILYKPSKNLVEFIKSIKNDQKNKGKLDDIPKGVANICNGKVSKKVDIENIKMNIDDYPSFIQRSDIEYINSLDLANDIDNKVEFPKAKCTDNDPKQTDKLLKFDDLTWLHTYIEKRNKDLEEEERVYFHKIFQGTEIILPKNEQIPRNEQLEARCEILRREQENRVYKAMTKNVDSTRQHHPEDTISSQMKQLNSQLIAVFQFVVSVLTGFVFGFLGIELMIGTLDFGFRLLLGIICALTIALAELYFLAKKLNEDLDETFKPTPVTSHHQNSKIKSE